MAVFSNKILLFTCLGYFLKSASSNLITFPTFTNGLNTVQNVFNIGSESGSGGCILPKALCDVGFAGSFQQILDAGPNLKDAISTLQNTDFLLKFREGQKNEDKDLTLTQLVTKYGFNVQSYTVQTEDGYVITVYRIRGKGEPVLLVHGLLNSAVDWLTIGRESALPFLLADEGYDVWLFNARGTTKESQGHIRLSVERNAKQYWDFSWDEIGRFDLPATIDFILKETGRSKLKYVGFSQGTTSFYVMASERPEYAKKVSLMVTLSPVAWMSQVTSPLVRIISPAAEFSDVVGNVIGYYKFNNNNPLIRLVADHVCGTEELATIICGNVMYTLTGFDYTEVNATQMPVIFAHAPSAVSSKQIMHYGQEINSGKFRRFDYGPIENLAKYGTMEPPGYPVEKISTPVALFYRKDSDWLSGYKDVLTLKNKLPNVVDFYEVPHESWSHTDYIWAKDVKELVYIRILDLFKKY